MASLDSSRHRLRDLVVVWTFPAAGVTLLLCVLLAVAAPPISRVGISRVVDVEPRIHCLIFQLQLEGGTAWHRASWQWGTVMGSSLVWQGGLAVRTGLRASVQRWAVF